MSFFVIDFVLQHRASFSAIFLKGKDCFLEKVFLLSCEFFSLWLSRLCISDPLHFQVFWSPDPGLRCHSALIGVITALPFLVFRARASTKSLGI